MRHIIKLSLTIAAFLPTMALANHITWLGQANLTNTNLKQMQTAKQVVLQQLVKNNIIDNTQTQQSAYRAIKIKLSANPLHPGAWIYLYSPAFLTFKTWFLPLNKDLTHISGAINKNPSFTPVSSQVDTPAQCPDPSIKALLFLPEYSASTITPSDPSTLSYMDRNMYQIIQNVTQKYPKSTKVLFGQNATRQNFLNVLSCPSLQFMLHVGGEDTDPDNKIFAGTAFWTADPSENPVTSADIKSTTAAKQLQTAIFATCHFFTNNTANAMCPLFTGKTIFPNINTYSGGITELPIPSAMATYNCLTSHLDSLNNNTLQQCANQYEPFAKNSQSKKIYIINQTNNTVTINSAKQNTPVATHDMTMLDTTDGPFTLTAQGQPIAACDDPTNTTDLSKPDELMISQHDKTQPPCFTSIMDDGLPIAERPDVGSGVLYGLTDQTEPKACVVGQSNFKADIQAEGSGDCASVPANLAFTLTADYADPGAAYQPVTAAAKNAGQSNPGQVTLNYSGGQFDPLFGYHYTGQWNNIALSNISNLPSDCQLTADDTQTVLDISGDGATIPLTIKQANTKQK